MVLWRFIRPFRTNSKKKKKRKEKDVLFIIGDWNAKLGSQEISGVTDKFGLEIQNEAGQRLTEFCQENTLAIANTLCQQHKRQLYDVDITRWSVPEQIDYFFLQLKMEKLYTVSKNKTWSWLWFRSWAPYWVGCHALLQEIFPTQGSNLGLLHCRQILYHLSHEGSFVYVETCKICKCKIQKYINIKDM